MIPFLVNGFPMLLFRRGRVKFLLMRKGPVHSRESSPNNFLTELARGLVFSDMIFPGVIGDFFSY